MWFFILLCSMLSIRVSSVSSQNHNVVASWVTPSCSCSHGYGAPLLSSTGVKSTVLRMRWRNKAEEKQAKNNSNQVTPAPTSPKQRVPFVIQKIGRGNTKEVEEITRMCIEVFFNQQDEQNVNGDETRKKKTAPWKALQLAYLRNFQQGEILARNAFKQDQLVNLVVARRVYSLSDTMSLNRNKAEIIDNESQIYNFEQLMPKKTYVTGEIIGYSEVSEKIFGLGGNFDDQRRTSTREIYRPYLSNLSVVEYARQSGVGSKLLAACEESVRDWNAGHKEIVLQVEEDNPKAIQFYKRRGWEFVFSDPTCRRYDTSGFFLKECRITKYTLIKRLDSITSEEINDGGESDAASSFIRKLRSSFFVQQQTNASQTSSNK